MQEVVRASHSELDIQGLQIDPEMIEEEEEEEAELDNNLSP